MLAGIVFSVGLILVLVGGAELFTGNNLIVMAWAGGSARGRCSANAAWRTQRAHSILGVGADGESVCGAYRRGRYTSTRVLRGSKLGSASGQRTSAK